MARGRAPVAGMPIEPRRVVDRIARRDRRRDRAGKRRGVEARDAPRGAAAAAHVRPEPFAPHPVRRYDADAADRDPIHYAADHTPRLRYPWLDGATTTCRTGMDLVRVRRASSADRASGAAGAPPR